MVFGWLCRYYDQDFSPVSYTHRAWQTNLRNRDAPPKPHANGLWLRSPAHPLFVPLLDYLDDHFGEPDRDGRSAGLVTHTYRPAGGVVRLTVADPLCDGSPVALWAHAQSAEALAAIARPLYRWVRLRDALVADTDVARAAVAGVRD